MTDKQPKPLQLADALDAVNTNNADSLLVQMAARSAAAELRRLHYESEKLKSLCRRSLQALWEDDFPSLRDELRKALGDIND